MNALVKIAEQTKWLSTVVLALGVFVAALPSEEQTDDPSAIDIIHGVAKRLNIKQFEMGSFFSAQTAVWDGKEVPGLMLTRKVALGPGERFPDPRFVNSAVMDEDPGEENGVLNSFFSLNYADGVGVRVGDKLIRMVPRGINPDVKATIQAGKILYAGAWPGIDVVYTASFAKVEEYFVIKGVDSPRQIAFDIVEFDGHVSVDPVDGTVSLNGLDDIPLNLSQPWCIGSRLSDEKIPLAWELVRDAAGSLRQLVLDVPVLDPGSYPMVVDPSWSTTGAMHWTTGGHQLVLLDNGRVMSIGGGAYQWYTQIYDPMTRTWEYGSALTGARSRFTATKLNNGDVLVVGDGAKYNDQLRRYEVFNAEIYQAYRAPGDLTNIGFRIISDPGVIRYNHTATLLADGSVLVCGGNDLTQSSNVGVTSVELFDSTTESWVMKAPMNSRRMHHHAVRLSNGDVFVAGGRSNISSVWRELATCEGYSVSTQSWTDFGSFSLAKIEGLAAMPNGNVLAYGRGYMQVFDTRSRTFGVLTPLPSQRGNDPAAATLPNGKLILAGGDNVTALSYEKRIWTTDEIDLTDPGLPVVNGPTIQWRAENMEMIAMAGGYRLLKAGGESTAVSEEIDYHAANNLSPYVVAGPWVYPNPVAGSRADVAVTADDDLGEKNLAYTWSCTAKPAGARDPYFADGLNDPNDVYTYDFNGTHDNKKAHIVFHSTGLYTISVTITDSSGATTTASLTCEVRNGPPTITDHITLTPWWDQELVTPDDPWWAQDWVTTPTTMTAIASAYQSFDRPLTFSWSVVQGDAQYVHFSHPSVLYPGSPFAQYARTSITVSRPGIYLIRCTVTNDVGLQTTSELPLNFQSQPTTVRVLPNGTRLNPGGSGSFTCTIGDQFGLPMVVPADLSWTSTVGTMVPGPSPATADLQLPDTAAGEITVRARVGGAFGDAKVVVNAAPTLESPIVATPNPVHGRHAFLEAVGHDDLGEPALIYNWSGSGTRTPVISLTGTNEAKRTVVTLEALGRFEIALDIVDGEGAHMRTPAVITLERNVIRLNPGGKLQLKGVVYDQFWDPMPTAGVNWSVDTAHGTITNYGLLTASSVPGGPYEVSALSTSTNKTDSVYFSINAQPVQITASTTVATTSEANPTPATVTLHRSGLTDVPLTVYYSASGTSVEGADFVTLPGYVRFPVGASSVTIPIQPIKDFISETQEIVIITVLPGDYYDIATPSQAEVQINEDLNYAHIAIQRPAPQQEILGGTVSVGFTVNADAPLRELRINGTVIESGSVATGSRTATVVLPNLGYNTIRILGISNSGELIQASVVVNVVPVTIPVIVVVPTLDANNGGVVTGEPLVRLFVESFGQANLSVTATVEPEGQPSAAVNVNAAWDGQYVDVNFGSQAVGRYVVRVVVATADLSRNGTAVATINYDPAGWVPNPIPNPITIQHPSNGATLTAFGGQ